MKNKELGKKSSTEHSDQMHTKCTEQSIWNFARGKDKVTQRSKHIRITIETLILRRPGMIVLQRPQLLGQTIIPRKKTNQKRWRKKNHSSIKTN